MNNKKLSPVLSGILSFAKSKDYLVVFLLLLVGFALRLYMAHVDSFLHPWDERFHALVARNIMHDPFKPMLIANPIVNDYDPNVWCCNHIWVHKQPLFMWQMALSMKIFGVSEFAMRLPGVLMGTIAIWLLYRITLIFSNFNKQIALIAAAIFTFSNFHLQLISGIHGMDQNDVAFCFYVLASSWAYAEYTKKPKVIWIVLIGVFSGGAVLCKWLTGLLVYLGWGANIVLHLKDEKLLKEIRGIILSLIVSCIVFVPWQLYIIHNFPNEAFHEYEYNRRHITESLKGFEESVFYYYNNFPSLIGKYIYFLAIAGIIISPFIKNLNRKLLIAFTIETIFVFCFFSFIVKTKVDTFFFIVVPLCFIFIAVILYQLFKQLRKPYLIAPIMAVVLYFSLDPLQIRDYLSSNNSERNARIYNASIYRSLRKIIPPDIHVVLNANSFENIDIMFYNNDITAYSWIPPEKDINIFKQRKMPIAVFDVHGSYGIPNYIKDYPYVFYIHKALKDFY